MSTSLFIVAEGPRIGDPLWLDRLREQFPGVRLVVRGENERVVLEPFRRAADFAALLELPKYRDDTRSSLRSLVLALFRWFYAVRIEMRDERKVQDETRCSRRSPDDAVEALPSHGSVVIEPPLVRHTVQGVRARLFQPLLVEGGAQATGFVANYDVVAPDEPALRSLLVVEVAADGAAIVEWGTIEVTEVVEDGVAGAERRGGRIYFGKS